MEIEDIRRARLRDWFASRSIPASEKSYISQLMTGKASFGEKAARRLEMTFDMGERYLDKTVEQEKGELDAFLRGVGAGYVKSSAVAELVTLFGQASQTGQDSILQHARAAAEDSRSRWRFSSKDKM